MTFNGVIITDDLEMGAISHPAAESAVAAVYAGADIVMFAHTPEKQVRAYDAIISAVKAGKLKEDDVNRSVVRILEMKKKYRLEWRGAAGVTATGTGATSSSVYNLSDADLQVVYQECVPVLRLATFSVRVKLSDAMVGLPVG
jgi:beta-glucosidase-like glycosyl hydrolase